ncbi:MAG: hypothetical protein OWT27_07355, partial [Firmicutes bacterium]|nr:hypothetical protein [Bacillota bacterium]
MNEGNGHGQGDDDSLCDGLLSHLLREGDAAAAVRMTDHVRTCLQCQERLAIWQEAVGSGQVVCDDRHHVGDFEVPDDDDLLQLGILAQDEELAQSLRAKVLAAARADGGGGSPSAASTPHAMSVSAKGRVPRGRWRAVNFA